MNIPSDCRIASIVFNHAMILPHDANPKPDGIFGTHRRLGELYPRVGLIVTNLSRQ
jgi:hypothetical protein